MISELGFGVVLIVVVISSFPCSRIVELWCLMFDCFQVHSEVILLVNQFEVVFLMNWFGCSDGIHCFAGFLWGWEES